MENHQDVATTTTTTTKFPSRETEALQDEVVLLWEKSKAGDQEATRRLLEIQEAYWTNRSDFYPYA